LELVRPAGGGSFAQVEKGERRNYDRRAAPAEPVMTLSNPDPSRPHRSARRLTNLRGPSVPVDPQRVSRFVVGISLGALAVLVAVLFVTATNKNAQDALLRRAGLGVNATVTKCLGNLSGSGSTSAGYTCRATFVLQGRRHTDVLSGLDVYRAPGTVVVAVTDPGDPGILATRHSVESAPSGSRPYVAPVVLLVVLVLAVALVGWRSRRRDEEIGGRSP
jgi:hypothetical protein